MSNRNPPAPNGVARTTGLLYLALGVTGMLGYLLVHSQIFEPDDATETLRRIVDREAFARVGLALEFGIVITQALVAVWFYRLFRAVDSFSAVCIAVFGLMNAAVGLISVAMTATAVSVATDGPAGASSGSVVSGDPAGTVQLLFQVSANLWGVGAIFFGLWLIPMGACVLATGSMPRALGWLLIGGGVGYVLSSFSRVLVPDAGAVTEVLTLPASAGEFWMIGYLLIRGLGSPKSPADRIEQPVASMP